MCFLFSVISKDTPQEISLYLRPLYYLEQDSFAQTAVGGIDRGLHAAVDGQLHKAK